MLLKYGSLHSNSLLLDSNLLFVRVSRAEFNRSTHVWVYRPKDPITQLRSGAFQPGGTGAASVLEPQTRSSQNNARTKKWESAEQRASYPLLDGRAQPRSMEHVRDNLARFQLEANGVESDWFRQMLG